MPHASAEELEPNLLLPFEQGWPSPAPTARAQALDWRPPRDGVEVRPLALAGERGGQFDMRKFSGWLRDADVIDQGPIELSGATVTLPHGMRLMRRFDTIVRRVYEDQGYEEYDYPLLVPSAVLEPTRKIMSLDNALLYVGDDEDWRTNRKHMVLTPTGEGAVYTHWSRKVRSRADLPLRTYRRTRYFRPSRSGRSVFRAIEAMDVYEFQACFADRPAAQQGFTAAVGMARQLCSEMHIPVLWGTRPPWTNNAGVSDVTIGGDVPLPHGSTIQVGSVYQQGRRFSELYDVGYRDGADRHYTHHVTGALTRRLVLVNLMLGMSADGELLLHPDLAPVQVGLTLSGGDAQERADALELVRRLEGLGVRGDLRLCDDRREVGRVQAAWRRQGMPLRIYLQARRNQGDLTRAVVVRADTRHEAVLLAENVSTLAHLVPPALDEVATGYLRRAGQFVRGQCRTADKSTVRDVLATRGVAVVPLLATEEAVTTVSSWGLGEVLGLCRTAEPDDCVVTGKPTFTRAYISPRR